MRSCGVRFAAGSACIHITKADSEPFSFPAKTLFHFNSHFTGYEICSAHYATMVYGSPAAIENRSRALRGHGRCHKKQALNGGTMRNLSFYAGNTCFFSGFVLQYNVAYTAILCRNYNKTGRNNAHGNEKPYQQKLRLRTDPDCDFRDRDADPDLIRTPQAHRSCAE